MRTLSATSMDAAMWDIQKSMWPKLGVSGSERAMYAIVWYVNTGRASAAFLKALINSDPEKVGNVLSGGGSVDEQIRKIHAIVGA